MSIVSTRVPLVCQTGEGAGEAEVSGRIVGEDRCVLRLWNGEIEITEEAADFFEALCKVRVKLEARGLLVATYGGSRNVFPSGMGRDMEAGLKAYRLLLGQPARSLVEIFDTGPDLELATVDQQRAFFTQWLSSIGIVLK